ncbi:ABC transporter permease [Roseibium aggregatum]|uniref:ABC transporter permease n=1 Tax=Roseibium aggregatum TaxID=187304 RepID=UPI00094B6E66|nr:hypothetical protein [Roseibium aggregatum]UFI06856.1 hypothetical protein ST40_029590 [Roseibium aggregatum]
MNPVLLVARQSLAALLRERSVILLAVIFTAMIAVSAWLGWSATQTVNAIYQKAADYLAQAGQPIAPNPVAESAPLSVLRNLTVYVSFLGAFAAIVIGQAIIEVDRRSGVLPLIGTRPIAGWKTGLGRIVAVGAATAGLMALAGAIATIVLVSIPGLPMQGPDWLNLASALLLGWVYISIFGFLALGGAALLPGTASGLLAATVVWLAITFVLPALTGNVNPTAAINPVSALASIPETPVFRTFSQTLGPFSLSEAFGWLEARTMGYLPDGLTFRGGVSPSLSLSTAFLGAGVFALLAAWRMDPNTGGPDA